MASPRVKNAPVKAYFALSYYTMLFVAIQEAIVEVQLNSETQRTEEPIIVISCGHDANSSMLGEQSQATGHDYTDK